MPLLQCSFSWKKIPTAPAYFSAAQGLTATQTSPHPETFTMTPTVQIRTLTSVPFEENCYVVWQSGRAEAVVIDPGLEPDMILDFLRDEGLTPSAILNTHGHADHIAGNEVMKQTVSRRAAHHRRQRCSRC